MRSQNNNHQSVGRMAVSSSVADYTQADPAGGIQNYRNHKAGTASATDFRIKGHGRHPSPLNAATAFGGDSRTQFTNNSSQPDELIKKTPTPLIDQCKCHRFKIQKLLFRRAAWNEL